MINYMNANNILHSHQSGFRNGFSTSSAALEVKEHIIDCLRNNKFVAAVLIDLSKAFDTVDHNILLKKLFCYGVRDSAFDWCESYLSARQQQVLVNDTLSDLMVEQPYGVPQGSVLGPLFFLLYINDIDNAINSSYYHLYADDTIIIQANNNSSSLIKSIESELVNVHEWLTLNKLTPNKKKCETIFFANQSNLKKCTDLKVNFMGEDLQTKKSVKYLGVYFDNKLSWKKQVSEIKRKINFKLAKIRPMARFIDPIDTYMLIRSFIFPYLHYCSTTWSSAAPSLIRKLQSTCDKTKLFSPLIPNIKVNERLQLDLSILTFKAIHNLYPDYICERLISTSHIHSHNTRQAANNNIFHSSCLNKTSTKSMKHILPSVWNPLPNDIKNENSLLLFKSKCKKYFLG